MAKVYIQFTNGKEKTKDFGSDILGAFRYQSQFVKKNGISIAQVIN